MIVSSPPLENVMKFTAQFIAFAAGALPAAICLAQSFPAKPLRMLVGFLLGSTTDVIGRLLAQKIESKGLGSN